MNNENTKNFLISSGFPSNLTLKTVKATDILVSSSDFFNENFRGAIAFDIDPYVPGYTDISADGFAYFFKVLLNAVFGESVVRISSAADAKVLTLFVDWKTKTEISSQDLAELKTTARLSGFDFTILKNQDFTRATITLNLKKTKVLSLYAVSIQTMRDAFVRVFFLT